MKQSVRISDSFDYQINIRFYIFWARQVAICNTPTCPNTSNLQTLKLLVRPNRMCLILYMKMSIHNFKAEKKTTILSRSALKWFELERLNSTYKSRGYTLSIASFLFN